METDEERADEAPPGWVLRTPNRASEVWLPPLLAVVVAAALVVGGVLLGDRVTLVSGVAAGTCVAVGAVVLGAAGRAAYVEQSRAASWRLHVVSVVVGSGSLLVVALGSLVSGVLFGVSAGVVVTAVQFVYTARTVAWIDRVALGVVSSVLAAGAAVLVVLGLTVPGVPSHRVAVWVGAGWLVAVVAAVVAVVQFRAAARTPRD
ncbi:MULTISPECIES: hypothetical protein [unclassified Curtobacterium]|uniref:hypothetical protein n=1 Tax=unclassified Curtobacterium TaxID=257496 RepID=UPI00380D9D97